MNQHKFLCITKTTLLLMLISFSAASQNQERDSAMVKSITITAASKHPMNFVKFNLTAIALKNYSLQYERILSRKFSFAIAYRTMPFTSIPFKKTILKAAGDDDPQTTQTINDFRMSNMAITPEIRFYAGKKGYGKGFYIAAFYRHASFKTNDVSIFYTDDAGNDANIKMSGKVTANTGGILLGVQHCYGKHIVLDIWILGPHYGSGKGDFTGITSSPLSAEEQASLKDELDSIDLPLTNKTVTVGSNSAAVNLDGPWGGIRAGLSLGVRF